MTWRREDTGYAVATLATLALVGYLLAANFGLVPSPLSLALGGGTPAAAAVEPVGSASVGVFLPQGTTASPSGTATPNGSAPPPSSSDRRRPNVVITTSDGTQFSGAEPATVDGRATDTGSGVARVVVTFSSDAGSQTVTAKMKCSDGSRRSCTWSARVPGPVGTYSVSATATDGAGNRAKARHITITVVNAGGTIEDLQNTIKRGPDGLSGSTSGIGDSLSGR